ncbi:MAG: tetratricopeptide repeat protein [Cyanobacteriota bacterium]|nr:tetratricopeptide repeat protein [Cyanobacteriota bacterium]
MKEIKEVAAALERQEYKQAAKLLKQLQKENPQNLWVKLYIGRWYEETDKLESAEKTYRKLLQDATNPQVMTQARQGLQRIETLEKHRQQEAIARAKSDPRNAEPALLILEPINKENKHKENKHKENRQEAIPNFARIMNVDPYTARMQLQNSGWRIYRIGPVGELVIYSEQLLKVGIPAFSVAIASLKKVQVFRVRNLQSVKPQITVVCENESDEKGSLTFNWSEVTAKVEGLLPIFIDAMDYDPRRQSQKFRRKEMTQDYANICDLHLPERQAIVRFCDRAYDFKQGLEIHPLDPKINTTENTSPAITESTNRIKWNSLIDLLNLHLSKIKVYSNFTPFGETTTRDYTQLLGRLKSYVDIERKEESLWDQAFQLYSLLAFLKNRES